MNAPTSVPAADPASVMGLFDNSHQQIAAMLQRLTQLANDLAEQGTTLPLRTEARAVRDWLGREAREHQAEERSWQRGRSGRCQLQGCCRFR